METEEFEVDTNEGDLCHYYGEWHVSGDLEKFLDRFNGKNILVTVKVLED